MARRRKKIVVDKEASDLKKRHGRFPTAPPTKWMKDKKNYSRKAKHKKGGI
jgi:hypothetical protein